LSSEACAAADTPDPGKALFDVIAVPSAFQKFLLGSIECSGMPVIRPERSSTTSLAPWIEKPTGIFASFNWFPSGDSVYGDPYPLLDGRMYEH
jgi:hypothetical protein